MISTNLENIGDRKLTEKELDALYLYLDMNMDSMSDEDRMFWMEILAKIDKQFYEDSSDGSQHLQ